MKKITVLAIAISFLLSCSTSNDVVKNGMFQKRKYNKGWYVNKTQHVGNKKGANENKEYIEQENLASTTNRKPNPSIETATANAIETVKSTKSMSLVAVPAIKKQSHNVTVNRSTSSSILEHSEVTEHISRRTPKKILKANKAAGDTSSNGHPMILLFILAIFLPPLAVGLVTDWETNPIVYNILWCLLCGLPGIIHAFIIIGRYR